MPFMLCPKCDHTEYLDAAQAPGSVLCGKETRPGQLCRAVMAPEPRRPMETGPEAIARRNRERAAAPRVDPVAKAAAEESGKRVDDSLNGTTTLSDAARAALSTPPDVAPATPIEIVRIEVKSDDPDRFAHAMADGYRRRRTAGEPSVCPECNWSNSELLNYGTPGDSLWLCHGCAARWIRGEQPFTRADRSRDPEVAAMAAKEAPRVDPTDDELDKCGAAAEALEVASGPALDALARRLFGLRGPRRGMYEPDKEYRDRLLRTYMVTGVAKPAVDPLPGEDEDEDEDELSPDGTSNPARIEVCRDEDPNGAPFVRLTVAGHEEAFCWMDATGAVQLAGDLRAAFEPKAPMLNGTEEWRNGVHVGHMLALEQVGKIADDIRAVAELCDSAVEPSARVAAIVGTLDELERRLQEDASATDVTVKEGLED